MPPQKPARYVARRHIETPKAWREVKVEDFDDKGRAFHTRYNFHVDIHGEPEFRKLSWLENKSIITFKFNVLGEPIVGSIFIDGKKTNENQEGIIRRILRSRINLIGNLKPVGDEKKHRFVVGSRVLFLPGKWFPYGDKWIAKFTHRDRKIEAVFGFDRDGSISEIGFEYFFLEKGKRTDSGFGGDLEPTVIREMIGKLQKEITYGSKYEENG